MRLPVEDNFHSLFPSKDENKFPAILKHSQHETYSKKKTWRKENEAKKTFLCFFRCNIKGKKDFFSLFFSTFSQDCSSLLHIFLTRSFATFHLAFVLSDASKEKILHMVKIRVRKKSLQGFISAINFAWNFSRLKIKSENTNRKLWQNFPVTCEKGSLDACHMYTAKSRALLMLH